MTFDRLACLLSASLSFHRRVVLSPGLVVSCIYPCIDQILVYLALR